MARARTGEAGNGPTRRERKPYTRLTPKQWGDLLALYEAGATAKALAVQFGTTERTIYTHAKKAKMLRKDKPWMEPCALDDAALKAGVRDARGCPEEAPIRALGADASLGEAAKAAAQTAILMLREAQPTGAYTYARLAATLERVARGAAGDGPVDGTERGRQAALDFLRREALADYPSTADTGAISHG